MKTNYVKFRVEDYADTLPPFMQNDEVGYGFIDGHIMNLDSSIERQRVAVNILKNGRKIGQVRFMYIDDLEIFEEEYGKETI